MNKLQYEQIENHMLQCMKDSAHDCQHIYRVLYFALDIAKTENSVDIDVIIAASLLHDIGREEQFKNPSLCHAEVGSEMAYNFLIENNWEHKKANHVKECIVTHRYRSDNPPSSIEAKILFDSDKLDVTGTIGIARTLLYKGKVGQPLYSVDNNHNVLDGTSDELPSFFKEYNFKLKNIYDKFYTKRAFEIAKERQKAAIDFYNSMLNEVRYSYKNGIDELKHIIK